MPQPNRQNAIPPARPRPQWPVILVTLLIGVMAIWLAWPQVFPGPDQANEMTLPILSQRASDLRRITDPVKRDSFCVPLSAYSRALDRALAPDARVFLTGMVGTNCTSLGYYFFLRNYLFPRDVEISLDGKATFLRESWVKGIPCDSPDILRTNGFDLMIQYANNQMQLIPLTTNGVPKPE